MLTPKLSANPAPPSLTPCAFIASRASCVLRCTQSVHVSTSPSWLTFRGFPTMESIFIACVVCNEARLLSVSAHQDGPYNTDDVPVASSKFNRNLSGTFRPVSFRLRMPALAHPFSFLCFNSTSCEPSKQRALPKQIVEPPQGALLSSCL